MKKALLGSISATPEPMPIQLEQYHQISAKYALKVAFVEREPSIPSHVAMGITALLELS